MDIVAEAVDKAAVLIGLEGMQLRGAARRGVPAMQLLWDVR